MNAMDCGSLGKSPFSHRLLREANIFLCTAHYLYYYTHKSSRGTPPGVGTQYWPHGQYMVLTYNYFKFLFLFL